MHQWTYILFNTDLLTLTPTSRGVTAFHRGAFKHQSKSYSFTVAFIYRMIEIHVCSAGSSQIRYRPISHEGGKVVCLKMSTVNDNRQKWLVWHFSTFASSTEDQYVSMERSLLAAKFRPSQFTEGGATCRRSVLLKTRGWRLSRPPPRSAIDVFSTFVVHTSSLH